MVPDQPATKADQGRGRIVRHARAITFQLAEVSVTGSMVRAGLSDTRQLWASPSCV